jgi:hypothetical protein
MHPAFYNGYADTMTKLAAVTEEDIAAALAGHRNRAISPEDIEDFSQRTQDATEHITRKRPYIGGGVGGALGSGLGAIIGGGMANSGKGALLGAGLGALGGGGLGALLGHRSKRKAGREGREWAGVLGNIAQEGFVPRQMPGKWQHEDLLDYAKGIQEDTAKPLTPEDFATIRKSLAKDMMLREGAGGALTGAMAAGLGSSGNYEGEEGDNAIQQQLIGAAIGGAGGALSGSAHARQRANLLADLYERGYGHLAGRLHEKNM